MNQLHTNQEDTKSDLNHFICVRKCKRRLCLSDSDQDLARDVCKHACSEPISCGVLGGGRCIRHLLLIPVAFSHFQNEMSGRRSRSPPPEVSSLGATVAFFSFPSVSVFVLSPVCRSSILRQLFSKARCIMRCIFHTNRLRVTHMEHRIWVHVTSPSETISAEFAALN